MSKTLSSRPSAIACTVVCVEAAVAIGTGASPERSLAQEKRNGSSDAKVELSDFGKAVGNPGAITEVPPSGAQPEGLLAKRRDQPDETQPEQRTQAIELFVDSLLGVCDEQTAKKRLETLQVKNLIGAVKAEMEGLEGDLVGIRQVTGEQFAALTEIVSSSISIATLGVTRDRTYLEVRVILTSKHAYVAVVTTELGGLPEEIVNKLKHADSPDAKADNEIQFDLPFPLVEIEPGEIEPGEVELKVVRPGDKVE